VPDELISTDENTFLHCPKAKLQVGEIEKL